MTFKVRPFLFSCVLSLLALAFPATLRGQFLGYVSQQTVTSTSVKNAICPTSGEVNIPNLGQNAHYLELVSRPAGSFDAYLSASYDGVNFFTISDILTTSQTGVFGSGYYPVVQIIYTCTGSGALTLNYTGQSGTQGTPFGGNEQGLVDKLFTTSSSAGSNFTTLQIAAPFGTSGGQIALSYSGTGPAGSTIAAVCSNGQQITPVTVATFTLATTAGVQQTFNVPSVPCPAFQLVYTSGGASVVTFALDMMFNQQGTSSYGIDPCQSNGAPKSSAVVTAAAVSTTQIVALAAGKSIYVCGFALSQTTSVGSLQWEYGTGSSCATGTTTLTGAFPTAAGVPLSVYGGQAIFTAPSGNALCLVTAGTAANAAGVLTYVQQ